jgi:hypothetical protein
MNPIIDKIIFSIVIVIFGSIGSIVVIRLMESLGGDDNFIFTKGNRPFLYLFYAIGIFIILISL